MSLYIIKNWHKRYENNQSRRVKDLAWVPIPARHDGERYSELMLHKNAAEIFATWILCLQVGARSEPRGSLVRSDGTPHNAASLSMKTRAPVKWFEISLPILVQMTWLEHVTDISELAPSVNGIFSENGVEERTERTEQKEPNPFKEKAISILAYLNEKAGTAYRLSANGNLDPIMVRLKDGNSEEDCRLVIESKCQAWKDDPKMSDYLRPETLFRASKFESYLGMAKKVKPQSPEISPGVRMSEHSSWGQKT